MAINVLAWRYDHAGDCNRYGNCIEHPFFERPALAELEAYPGRMPDGAMALQYVASDVVEAAEAAESGYDELKRRSDVLRAAVGEAIHALHREHPERVREILDSAVTEFDRGRDV